MGDKPRYFGGRRVEGGILKIVHNEINPEMHQLIKEIRREKYIVSMGYVYLACAAFATFALGYLIGFSVSLGKNKEMIREDYNNIGEIIRKYDSDDDGRLSSSEFEAYLKSR